MGGAVARVPRHEDELVVRVERPVVHIARGLASLVEGVASARRSLVDLEGNDAERAFV